MSHPTAESHTTGSPTHARCPACGQTLDQLDEGKCPLCAFQVQDPPITSQDTTPFARTSTPGWGAWWTMCRWTYPASDERLSYLSLVRLSPASRRFARNGLLLFALAAGCLQLTHAGWQRVLVIGPDDTDRPGDRRAAGWYELGMTGSAAEPSSHTGQSFAIRWNPAISATTAAVTFFVALLIGWWWLRWVDWGALAALGRSRREEGRLSCALRYSTAWLVPVCMPILLILLRPLWYLDEARGWDLFPPTIVLYLPVVILAALGLIMWWLWLIRLSLTVPLQVRTRVLIWYTLAAPVLGVLLVAGAAYGLRRGSTELFAALGMGG